MMTGTTPWPRYNVIVTVTYMRMTVVLILEDVFFSFIRMAKELSRVLYSYKLYSIERMYGYK